MSDDSAVNHEAQDAAEAVAPSTHIITPAAGAVMLILLT